MHEKNTVHVVDDDPGMRESLKTLLKGAGYNVECYSSGEAFVADCARAKGCALVDLRLQDIDGLAVQEQMVAAQSQAITIMMSAFADVQQAVKAMRLGAVDFFEKPFDPDGLLKRIAILLHGHDGEEEKQRQARQHASLIELLTAREHQVLQGVVDGKANKQVAGDLGISARTVETHRVHIMQKLQADSLAHLVRIWLTASAYMASPYMEGVDEKAG